MGDQYASAIEFFKSNLMDPVFEKLCGQPDTLAQLPVVQNIACLLQAPLNMSLDVALGVLKKDSEKQETCSVKEVVIAGAHVIRTREFWEETLKIETGCSSFQFSQYTIENCAGENNLLKIRQGNQLVFELSHSYRTQAFPVECSGEKKVVEDFLLINRFFYGATKKFNTHAHRAFSSARRLKQDLQHHIGQAFKNEVSEVGVDVFRRLRAESLALVIGCSLLSAMLGGAIGAMPLFIMSRRFALYQIAPSRQISVQE